MNDNDRAHVVEELQRRVDVLENEAARLRLTAVSRHSTPFSGSRRQVLLGGAGLLGALAGGALLGRAAPSYAASDESTGAPHGPPWNETVPPRADKHLTLRTTLTPLKTHGLLWANYDWDLGAHFVDEHPPVVVATALDDYMAHDVASFCVCAVAVHGKPGAYRATIMVRNISAFATEVEVNAVAFGV